MDPRFTPVRDCFQELLTSGRERGAGLAVWYDGRIVVDLFGGTRSGEPASAGNEPVAAATAGAGPLGDGTIGQPLPRRPDRPRRPGQPWRPDTLVNVYSSGKPLAALCVLVLVERGRLGLDDPVQRHWPGFRAAATVRQLLAHTAGLPASRYPDRRPRRGYADPAKGFAFAYTPGRLAGFDRVESLAEAVESCLATDH